MSSEAKAERIWQPEAQRIRRVLVIDDEKLILWLLQESLGPIPNCLVFTAGNGEEALDWCERLSFDLVITDYKLPGLDGLTLSTIIRRLQPKVEILMLTGYGYEVRLEGAARSDILHILNKPVKPAYIREIVANLLDHKRDTCSFEES